LQYLSLLLSNLSSSNAARPSARVRCYSQLQLRLQANAIRFSSLSCMRSRELCRLARGDCSQNSNVNSSAGAVAQGKDVDREFEMKSKICGCFSVSLEQSTTGPIAKRAQRARLLLAGWEIEGGRYPVTAN